MYQGGSHGTLLLFSPQSSRLSIRYYHHDLRQRALKHRRTAGLRSARRTSLHRARIGASNASTGERGRAMSAVNSVGISIVHFRGRLVRQVSCYTLLGGFRLPWPPSCCLYQPTPLNLNEPLLDALNQLSDHPHCQSCLPKLAHLARLIQPLCSTRKREPAPFSSLRIGLGC